MNRIKPLGRALPDFVPLRPGELHLLNACKEGKVAKLGEAVPESATDEQSVRAGFVRFLLQGGDEHAPVHEQGVKLQGAFIEGPLDLLGCHIPANVALTHSRFNDRILAIDAQIGGSFSLQGSHLTLGLSADRIRCSGSFFLRTGFKTKGEVRMLGAQIGGDLNCEDGLFEVTKGDALSLDCADIRGTLHLSGQFTATGTVSIAGTRIGRNLDCTGAQLKLKKGDALFADGANVAGDVVLSDTFKATGEVRLLGLQIGGDLNCRGGQFQVEEGDALSVHRATVKGSVFLRDGFRATGAVNLISAQIGGDVDCLGGIFQVKEGIALSADSADIKGSVYLCGSFKATGEVCLLGVQIGGNLGCSGGQFTVKSGQALSADRSNIKGTVTLSDGFKSTGEVIFSGAQIGSDLNCSGGLFDVKEGNALVADGVDVKGTVTLGHGFKATGEVRLLGAQIGGNLSCKRGVCEVKNGKALSADRARVKGDASLSDGFKATGEVRLLGTLIGGNLDCSGGQFDAPVGTALSLDHAIVRGAWHLHNTPNLVRVDASHADVAVLVDDLTAWAPGSVLNGFRYAALGGTAPTKGADRLKWLSSQPMIHLGGTDDGATFCPQPWRHLQRVLREMGHTEDAKQVGIAFEDHLRAIGKLGQSPEGTPAWRAFLKRKMARGSHYIFGKLVAYGYRPTLLVTWMIAVWLSFGTAYWWLALPPRSAMAPSDPLVFQNANYAACLPDQAGKLGNWYLCSPLRGEYATFSPYAFSLDVMLPVVDLGQEKTWGAFVPTPQENPVKELFLHWHWGHFARLLTWLETLFGWLSSLLLVAIVSGFARRNDEG